MRPGLRHTSAWAASGPGRARAALRSTASDAFRAFVRRSDDRRLERTIGTAPGLRLLFSAMRSRFVPSAAAGFTGDVLYDLRSADGRVRPWTVTITPDRALARPGRPPEPRLTVRLTVADLARLAGGELDAGSALLEGRLDLEGDVALAARLGEMFGRDGR